MPEGGGMGSGSEHDPGRVARDVRGGLLSTAAASYKVALWGNGGVDGAATRRLPSAADQPAP
jgi:hypothetical protein